MECNTEMSRTPRCALGQEGDRGIRKDSMAHWKWNLGSQTLAHHEARKGLEENIHEWVERAESDVGGAG